ncbi:MAG: hypothetical protein JWL84_4171 [Rhodospirillales bacterium]|nr:hypothetical protein [Rhodospirillales bacterium]
MSFITANGGATAIEETTGMTKSEAREAIQTEWLARPETKRSTEHQAAIFAMKAMQRFDFRAAGDRYQVVKSWLLQS